MSKELVLCEHGWTPAICAKCHPGRIPEAHTAEQCVKALWRHGPFGVDPCQGMVGGPAVIG